MKNIFNAQKQELIEIAAVELKKQKDLTPPEWAQLVKTGTNKERPPVDPDWWYMRASSMLVRVMNLGPIGVSKLRVKYGGKKRRGHAPAEFRKSSGNIIRKILQQLETAGLVKQEEKSGHKGRVITPQGISLLDSAARSIKPKATAKETKKAPAKKAAPKKETKKEAAKEPAKKEE